METLFIILSIIIASLVIYKFLTIAFPPKYKVEIYHPTGGLYKKFKTYKINKEVIYHYIISDYNVRIYDTERCKHINYDNKSTKFIYEDSGKVFKF